MAPPKRSRPKAPWKSHKRGRPKERMDIIIEILENSPGTFEELRAKTSWAGSTLTEKLAELEKQDRITRTVEPPKERGRGKKSYRLIYELSETELDPVVRTIRHLKNITAIPMIDDSGKTLLTNEVVDAILEISTLSFRKVGTPKTSECHHPPGYECFMERERMVKDIDTHLGVPFKKLEIDENHLLRGLSRFYVELCLLNAFKRNEFEGLMSLLTIDFPPPDKLTIKDVEPYNQKKQIIQLLKRRKDSEVLPSHEIARLTGTINRFEDLLKWIWPLIRFEDPNVNELKNLVWMKDFNIGLQSWNLAGEVFRLEASTYFETTLIPSYEEKSKEVRKS
jgi:DNA-binding HxlR family transcriptional regulator